MSDPQQIIPTFDQVMQKDTLNGKIPSFDDIMGEEPSKKKVGSLLGGMAGNGLSQSNGKVSEKQKVLDYVYGLKTSEEKKLAQPDAIAQVNFKKNEKPFEPTEKDYTKAYDKINEVMLGDNGDWKDPIKSLQNKYDGDIAGSTAAINLTQESLMPSGYKALRVLSDSHFANEGADNLTANMLKYRADRYNKVAQPFRELGNINYDDERDFGTRWKIYDSAIRAYANKNPHFAAQAQAAGIDLNSDDLALKLGSDKKSGQIMADVLNDPDLLDYVQNENPNLLPSIKKVSDDLIYDNKEYGKVQLANEISREMERSGYNKIDPIFNFKKEAKESGDATAKSLYISDPKKLQFYEENKGEILNMLDAPSLLEGFAGGAKRTLGGIKNTFTVPFESIPTQIKDNWEKEASHVSADPKGLVNFLRNTGDVLGLVATIGATGNVLGGGGAGVYSRSVVPAISGSVPFFGDMLETATSKYPNSPVKAWVSAITNTAMYAALSQSIFPASKAAQAIKQVEPSVSKVIENLTSGSIKREVARRELQTLTKKAIDFAGGSVLKSAKIAGELTAIGMVDKALDKIMGLDKTAFEQYHPQGQEADTFGSMFLSNLVLGGMVKFGEMKRGNRIVEESLYSAATNPKRFERVIESIDDPSLNKEQMLSNLKFVADTKAVLDSRGVDERNQKRYLFNALKNRIASEERTKLPDENLVRKHDEENKRFGIENDKILNGEDIVGDDIFENNIKTPEGKLLKKAIDSGDMKDRLSAETALKTEGGVDMLLKEIADQALNKIAPDESTKEQSLQRAKEAYGEELTNLAIKKFPGIESSQEPIKEETGEPPVSGVEGGDVVRHKQNIHDKFRKEFEAKGVPKEQVDGAIALMEARAKSWASEEKGRNPDDWYSRIADVKSGEFVDGSGRQFQVEAYHGSPHDFDKFSISKIGTGEGAAAFGHGLYFTDLKGIAEEYARRLSNDTPIIDGKKIDDWFRDNDLKAPYSSNYWMPELLSESKSKDEALSKIDLRIKSQEGKIDGYNDILDDGESTQNERAGARRALEILEKDLQVSYDLYNAVFRSKNFEPPSKGRNLYKVSLHEGRQPNEYNWLDWDKDLPKEKIDKIRKALLEYDLPDGYSWATDSNKNKNHVVHQVKDAKGNIVGEGIDKEEASKDAGIGKRFYPYFGEERRLAEFDKVFKRNSDGKYTTGAGFYHRLSELLGSDKAASDLLLKAGIDGVKYPAESIARGATSDNARGFNYVVFDDKAVTIKEKVQFQNNKGAVETLSDGRKVIHALDAPDFSTMVHEIAHVFEGDLTTAEQKIVKDFGGSEPFARGFERYLRDGKAPTTELKTLFEKFKQWLTNIYKTLKGSPIEKRISPEIKKIFDRLLTEQQPKEQSTKVEEQAPVSGVEGGDVVAEKIQEDKDTLLVDGIKNVSKNKQASDLLKIAMNRGVIPERLYNDFGKELAAIKVTPKSKSALVDVAELIQKYSDAKNEKTDAVIKETNQAIENADFEKRAYEGMTEQEKFEAVIEDKAQTSEKLTPEELNHVNENYFIPKGYKYNESWELVKSKKGKEQSTKVEEHPQPKQEQSGKVEGQGAEMLGETTQQSENKPPEPPQKPPAEPIVEGDGEGGKKKSLPNRLIDATNLPQEIKDGIKNEGLTYNPRSHKQAQALADAILENEGIENAVLQAQAGKFGGDVNTLIQTSALDKISELSSKETDPSKQLEYARQFVDIENGLDQWLRNQAGRGISALAHFYKKTPLGVVMKENQVREKQFEQWAKPKDKSWHDFFDEMMKDPEFEKEVTAKVKEELKKERQESRKNRIKKVDEWFDKAKDQFKGGAAYSTIIPPKVITTALEGMRKAYHAGEKVAEIIQNAIDEISAAIGNAPWDKDKFRKEWEDRLAEKTERKPLTDEEIKTRILDKFRKKLKGLSDKERDEVIRRSFKKIIDSGGLDYEDFRKIIGEVTGRKELSVAEAEKLKELVKKTNAVEEAAIKARTERTQESLDNFRKTELEAGKATKDLQEMFYNKPDIVKRLTSVMQLNTLGIPSLINNPIYNIWNQMGLRFPIGVINDAIDRVYSGIGKLMGKNIDREYNVWETQKEFWSKLGLGAKESFQQLFTGLNRMDYTQKELYGQRLRPFKAWRDLIANAQGKKKLTGAQKADKAIEATVGIPAEIVARVLNLGDKPQRFAAEGAQASAFAKALGLKDMDYKLFIEFPREEAYNAYKAQGLSDAEASQRADYVKEAIIKEGQRSTFQQDNLLNDVLTRAFGVFGGKESGTATLVKSLAVSPYVKIPSNAFWSMYNLLNPEVAALQSLIHKGRSEYFKGKNESTKSKLANREARYWMAHAIVGIATRAVIISLVKQGVFTPGSDQDDSKKERDATQFFDKPGTTQVGNLKISNRWFGQLGMIGNAISKKYYDATPEQREKQDEFWNIVFGKMEVDGLKELQNGVFANSSSILQALDSGNPNMYLANTLNMMANIVQPASVAQINRASLPYVYSAKDDSFIKQINQSFAQRSPLYRWATGTTLNKKRDIWGQEIPRDGTMIMKLFGISKVNPQIFARPVYEDFRKTGDSGFLPPAVLPILNDKKLNTEQYNRLQEYIGNERKRLVEPYINDMAVLEGFNKTYSELNDKEKKDALHILYGKGRDKGVEKFYSDFPELKPNDEKDQYYQSQKTIFNELQDYK